MAGIADTPVGGREFEGGGGTPVEDWASAIAAQPPSSRRSAGPPQGRWLSFRDRALERAYLQFEYERSKNVIVIGLAIGVLIQLLFLLVLDPFAMPPEHLELVKSTRLWFLMPVVVAALIGSILIKDITIWIPFESALLLCGCCWLAALVLFSGGALFDISAMGLWNMVVIAFFICGLPLRWSAGISLVGGAIFAISSSLVPLTDSQWSSNSANFAMMYLFSAFATYRYERATRLQFVAQGMSQILSERRLASEVDRRKWLEVIAAFLRHELNNAMTAISSSVDLADRAVERAKLVKFLGRARRSTLYMRRLLAQVADATSLESALVQRTFERISLSDLLRDRVLDLQEDHGSDGLAFEADIDDAVQVHGNPDALTQMLDKLFNNAREHGLPGLPVRVELRRNGEACTLVVSDQGDPLPDDVERLFRPFVSSKARRSRGDNLGLGLFVARTIAIHHGGSLTAEPLNDGREGARFAVSLPLAAS